MERGEKLDVTSVEVNLPCSLFPAGASEMEKGENELFLLPLLPFFPFFLAVMQAIRDDDKAFFTVDNTSCTK